MRLHWPDERVEQYSHYQRSLEAFMLDYRDIKDRVGAVRCLSNVIDEGRLDAEGAALVLENHYPEISARIRSEAAQEWLRTFDGLRAEVAIAESESLSDEEAAIRLGNASRTPLGKRLISEALADATLRSRVVQGVRVLFAGPPALIGEGPSAEAFRNALVNARKSWADPNTRDLADLRAAGQSANMFLLLAPEHVLMGPLFEAAPQEALALLDKMPSPLDAALICEYVDLGMDRFESWARSVRLAPAAWDRDGWIGSRSVGEGGLALPLLLWSAEGHLRSMGKDAVNLATPGDTAQAIRARCDGDRTAWHWCASLLARADRDDSAGRAHPADGVWRTAQALASAGGWDGFDPGRGPDALLLEAAQRLVPDSGASGLPPRLGDLLSATPEAFLDDPTGKDLSDAAFLLVSGCNLLVGGRAPYGTVTRILASGLLGAEGPERFDVLWKKAHILRELAAGGIRSDQEDRKPEDALHLIIALGLSAVELIHQGAIGEADELLALIHHALMEIQAWDALGFDALHSQFESIRVGTTLVC